MQGGGIFNAPFFDGMDAVLTLTERQLPRLHPGLDVSGGGLFTAVSVTLEYSKMKDSTPDQCFGC